MQKIKSYITVFLLLLAFTLQAQQINKAEYFYDTDPGVGKGVGIAITQGDSISKSIALPTTSLSVGVHRLNIRVRNTTGKWSISDSRNIFISPNYSSIQNQLAKAEYFFDTDPGVGKGTPTSITQGDSISLTQSINVSALSVGMHRIYFRIKNQIGVWSIADSRAFLVLPSSATNTPKLTKAEYFFDKDPGVGKGTAITVSSAQDSISLTQNISVNGLSAGIHRLYFRTRNANGTWSISDGRSFSVISSFAATRRRIKKAEYFFDTDPGVGKGTPISTGSLADSISISNLSVSLSGLAAGSHKVFVRAMDSTNIWSIAQGKAFTTCTSITYPNFTYVSGCAGTTINFTNTSTGNGTGTAIYTWKFGDGGIAMATSTSHIYNTAKTYDVTLIASNGGACADTIVKSIVIGNTPGTINVTNNSQPTTFCKGGNVLLTSSSSVSNVKLQWQNNNVDLPNDTSKNLNVTTSGTYRCKATNSCGTVYSTTITVVVNEFPIVSVTPPANNSICSGGSLILNGSATGSSSQIWYKDGNPIAGATSNNYTVTAAGDYSFSATNGCGTSQSKVHSIAVVPNVPASVSITASVDSICPGEPVVFAASPIYGGSNPTFQWQKNGVQIVGATQATYSTNTAINNDSYTVVMNSSETCLSSKSATSNAKIITVTSIVNASVAIAVTSSSICAGKLVTFTAKPVGGGSSPTYQWRLNGTNITGATNSTYSVSTLTNNDLISVVMKSNSTCATGSPATSLNTKITVSNPVSSAITINTSTTSICANASVTFTASSNNGGATPSYQWIKNGVDIVGATSSTFTTSNINNLDSITCEMVSSIGCTTNPVAKSNTLKMVVTKNVLASVTINTANTNACVGDNVSFYTTLANGLNNVTYQWKLNGNLIVGATNQIYSSNSLANSDLISLTITSTDACVIGSPANSNIINLTVNKPVVASLAIATNTTTACAGSEVVFTAFPVNGGNVPTYTWAVNGLTQIGENAKAYSTKTLNNGDVVSAQLISNAACVSGSPAASNSISMIINTCSNSISTGSIAGSPFCNNMLVLVPFNTQGSYNTGNVYYAELSDAAGSFTNATKIGSLASISHSGQIICTMPSTAISSNKYRIRVVSDNPITIGQDNKQDIEIINGNFSLNFEADTTKPSLPYNVQFTNKTANLGDYNFIWYFGDGTNYAGTTPPVHQYIHDGKYAVSLQAIKIVTGCTDTLIKSNYIVCDAGKSICGHQVSIAPNGPINGCIGGSAILTCNTNATLPTYQWNINGVPIGGATQPSLLASATGYYSVTVYDNGACPITTNLVGVNFNKTAPEAPIITSVGSVLSCVGGTKTLTASTGFANYLWSTGETAQSIQVTQSGYYSVTANNAANVGCDVTSNVVTVNASPVTAPDICMVTVDTTLGKKGKGYNLIVWEKPVTADIDSFIVFKETTKAGIYKRIGAVNYNSLSEFIDTTSRPNVHADRYKLAARDTCGGITLPSTYHKTMHLQVSPGVKKDRNLSWTHEVGIPFDTYYIYRGDPSQKLVLIDSIASSYNTYTDLKVSNANAYYQVQVVLPNGGCTSTKSMMAQRRLTQSNLGTNSVIENPIDGVSEFDNSITANLIPNPNNGLFSLQLELMSTENVQIRIIDIAGQLIVEKTKQFATGKHNLPFELSTSGMYFVIIQTSSGILSKKVVVE